MDHHHRHELQRCDCGAVDFVHTLTLVGALSQRYSITRTSKESRTTRFYSCRSATKGSILVARRAGPVTREQRNDNQQEGHAAEDRRVGGADAV